jgi:hypothetical protein
LLSHHAPRTARFLPAFTSGARQAPHSPRRRRPRVESRCLRRRGVGADADAETRTRLATCGARARVPGAPSLPSEPIQAEVGCSFASPAVSAHAYHACLGSFVAACKEQVGPRRQIRCARAAPPRPRARRRCTLEQAQSFPLPGARACFPRCRRAWRARRCVLRSASSACDGGTL